MPLLCVAQKHSRKIYMQHWLFVDGAGKPQPDRYVAYCGYLVGQAETEEFFVRWQSVLYEEQIPYLTMKECQHWSGPTWSAKRKQWGDQADTKRQQLLMKLAGVIVDTRLYGFGHAVNTSACREQQIEPTEYFLFVRLMDSLFEYQGDTGQVELIVVVDEEESAAERIYKFYRKLRRERKDLANQIKLIGIGDDRVIPGLQAADLLAYTTVAEMNRRVNRNTELASELWTRLMHSTNEKAITHEWFAADPHGFLRDAGIF
jgi:hypothetical protein